MADGEPLKRTETLEVRPGNPQQAYVGGYYTPEPYQTVHIPRQSGFDQTRGSISHAFSAFGNALIHPYGPNEVRTPRADIYETATSYIIHVDVPGLESKKTISIKWLNNHAIFLEADTKRPDVAAEGGADVHLVVQERKVGKWARAFQFPVAVDQDATKARFGYGVVRLTVPKKGQQAQQALKEVQIEHDGN